MDLDRKNILPGIQGRNRGYAESFREKGQVEEYDEALKGYLNYETSEVKRILREILNG